MSRVLRTPLADQDLEDIWFFIAQDNVPAADRLLDTLNRSINVLAKNPNIGPSRPDIAKDLRYHPIRSYLLLYRIIKDGIEIVRVVHGARDLFHLL
jgi:toxin ParE1/3/4